MSSREGPVWRPTRFEEKSRTRVSAGRPVGGVKPVMMPLTTRGRLGGEA